MKTLIIAEKPSVARDIAAVIGGLERQDGYYINAEYVVSWAVGHLVQLADPEIYDPEIKKWDLANLPIIPDKFKLTVIEKTKKQFGVLRGLLRRKDITVVINACDAGREGELIFRWIYKAVGANQPVRRLWLSEMTPSAINEALRTARDGQEYYSLYAAAEARAKADWLVGINATRAFSVKHDTLMSVGRVQTPTLALMVSRENEIKYFNPVPYWQVQAKFTADTGDYVGLGLLGESDRFDNESEAREFSSRVLDRGNVVNINKTEKAEAPPTLFNLNDLQKEANRIFGLTALKTLEIAQGLYEKKLITYPRTDSRYLTNSLAGTLAGRIGAAQKQVPFDFFPSPVPFLSKRYIDDAKVTDHHAIITTNMVADGLAGDELKVYELICRRFISVFLPPYAYSAVEVITQAGERFMSKGREVICRGWREIYNYRKDGDDETVLPALNDGQAVSVTDIEVLAKETKPPARYTDASILGAMEHAGRFVEDEDLADVLNSKGIGTPATRAAVIEKLINVGYIERAKKSLVPTTKGVEAIALMPDKLKVPQTTAEWEDGLARIENGEYCADQWLMGIKTLTTEVVIFATEQVKSAGVTKKESLGKCPLCGSDVTETKKGYSCSAWKESGCKFVIWKEIVGKKITIKQAQELLEKKKSGLIKGFKSKKGNNFEAYLVFNEAYEVKFEFDTMHRKQATSSGLKIR